jgi:hypothetical protein
MRARAAVQRDAHAAAHATQPGVERYAATSGTAATPTSTTAHGGRTMLTERGVEELMGRLSAALAPYQSKYLRRVARDNGTALPPLCASPGYAPPSAGTYLAGCTEGCRGLPTLAAAQRQCDEREDCGGVTQSGPVTRPELRRV